MIVFDPLTICQFYVVSAVKASEPVAPIKIGISANARRRFTQLRSSSPVELRLLFAFDLPTTEDALLAETEAHKTIRPYHLRGEWFDFPPEHGLYLCSSIAAVVAGQGHSGAEFLSIAQRCGCPAADQLAERLWPYEAL